MPYFGFESSFEGEEEIGEGCCPRIKFDGEDPNIGDNSCKTPTCFQNSLFPRWECASPCYETECSEDVDSLDYFQQMDEKISTEDQILKHLEEKIVEVIIRELHCKMVVTSGPQYIVSSHGPNDFLEEDGLYEYSKREIGLYDSNEVRSKPMSFTHDTLYFQ